MKNVQSNLWVLTALFATLFIFLGCKTSKNTLNKESTMILLLAKNQQDTYISQNYAAYKPSQIKKINRTLNQYRVKFSYSNSIEEQLLQQLKEDSNVLEFKMSEEGGKGTNIQSGTNKKSAKTKPIIKN